MRDRGAERSDKRRTIASAHLASIPADTLVAPVDRGFDECPCPKRCTLHGECRLCVAYHSRKGKPPRCER